MQVVDPTQTLIFLLILIMSVVMHEVTHGYVAELLGDPTARLSGRLTLNPISHLDPIGSFLVPLMTLLLGLPMFGWAKPVPYNPYNLKGGKWGPALVAIAGPTMNLLLAAFFAGLFNFQIFGSTAANDILLQAMFINLLLFTVNMIPVPPIDGSKVLFAIIPDKYFFLTETLEKYSLVLILFLLLFIDQILIPVVAFLSHILVGSALGF